MSLQPRDSLLYAAARSTYHSLRGVYRGVRSLRNRLLNRVDPPLIVLLYHRVAELPSDPEMLAVTPGNFRRQLEYLREHCRIVRFEEDWSGLREPAVAITFDDGYADNFLEALPILEELEVPATFFVSSGRLGTGEEFWWHRLEALLLREGSFPPHFELRDARFDRSWETATLAQRRRLYTDLNLGLLQVGPDRQQAWLEQLANWAGCRREGESLHRSMSQKELQALAASPWTTIGAHTVSHSALSALSEKQQHHEIFTSRDDLEAIIEQPVTTFSYPFGRKRDYNRTSVQLCREAGFIKVAANFPGQIHRWTNPFQLPRHLVRNWDLATFVAKLNSFWTR